MLQNEAEHVNEGSKYPVIYVAYLRMRVGLVYYQG